MRWWRTFGWFGQKAQPYTQIPPKQHPQPRHPEPVARRTQGTRGHTSKMAPLLAGIVALLSLGLGACSYQSVYKAVDADQLAGRSVLFLHLQAFFAKDTALQLDVMNAVEEKMASMPGLRKGFIGRKAFLRQHAENRSILRVYNSFSLLLVGSMLPNREQSTLLAKATKASLLSGVQVETIACQACEKGDQVWLVGQLIDANTGRILLRAYLSKSYSSIPHARVMAIELAHDWVELLRRYTRPKWHQQRIKHLRALATNQDPPP